jgi:hypothetical protein
MGGVFKFKWAAKLYIYPFWRLILSDHWFRRAIFAFLALQIFLLLFLPKIWRTTPPGFSPEIRISGLDYFQAWKFKRTALRRLAQGQAQEAADAWRLAWGYNPANPQLIRGSLNHGLNFPETVRHSRELLEQAGWLLQLTATNLLHLELAAEVFHRYDALEPWLPELRIREPDLPLPLRRLYLKTLFYSGRFPSFNESLHKQEALLADAEIGPLALAYAAIAGTSGERAQARENLESALHHSPSPQIGRALFQVALHHKDLATCAQLLNHLGPEAPFRDHLAYWRLTAVSLSPARALSLAIDSPARPESLNDLIAFTQFFTWLEKPELALHWFERFASSFAPSPGFWIHYADQLVQMRQWTELWSLALRIRYTRALQSQLTSYSYFLEGHAAARLTRNQPARIAFLRMLAFPFQPAALGTETASTLLDLGELTAARDLLRHLEEPLKTEIDYWLLFFKVADQLKDPPLMLETSAKARALAPSNPLLINNHAAALLIQREQPELAVQLTLQVLNLFPNSLAARMNHSAALILNQRVPEAAAWLRTIPADDLTPSQSALYHFNWLQICLALGQTDPARQLISRIEENWLYIPQKQWLDQARLQLQPAPG